MVIKEVIKELKTSSTPVINTLLATRDTEIIVIGLKKGVTLKEHQAPTTAKLVVIKGKVNFATPGAVQLLKRYEEHAIPLKVSHSVTAVEDAVCLLILTRQLDNL